MTASSRCENIQRTNADHIISDRKRPGDKVYPKGFAEMVERNQEILVAALYELVNRARDGRPFTGQGPEYASNGAFSIHDVISDLGLLRHNPDSLPQAFEEDTQKMRDQLCEQEDAIARRGSLSSDESGNHDYVRTPSDSRETPFESKPNEFDFAPPSRPASQSPGLEQLPISLPRFSQDNDPQLYIQAPWGFPEQNHNDPMLRSPGFGINSYPMDSPQDSTVYHNVEGMNSLGQWSHQPPHQHMTEAMDGYQTYPPQTFNGPILHHNPTFMPMDDFYGI